MYLGMFLGAVLVAAVEGVLLWCVWRRLAEHLTENPEAVSALTNHLFVPLMGRKARPQQNPAVNAPGNAPAKETS
jgi:hypothetical protein